MGLDMYLYKKSYVKNWDHMTPENKHNITIEKGGKLRTDIKPNRICYIVEEVAYWRKANHIHKWFVENCQDGIDDCRSAYVSREQLQELLDLCKQVRDDHSQADELLPTQSGFFFGGTEYDEYYFNDIDYTIKVLEEILSEEGSADFEYNSSW